MEHAVSKEAVMLSAEADQIIEELLHTTAGRTNPYPLLHRLRALAPVHRNDEAADRASLAIGAYFSARHLTERGRRGRDDSRALLDRLLHRISTASREVSGYRRTLAGRILLVAA